MKLFLDEGTLHAKIYLCTFSHCNFYVYRFLYIFILCNRRIRWKRYNLYRYPISFLSKKRKPSLMRLSSVFLNDYIPFVSMNKSPFKRDFHLILCNRITNTPNLITILQNCSIARKMSRLCNI